MNLNENTFFFVFNSVRVSIAKATKSHNKPNSNLLDYFFLLLLMRRSFQEQPEKNGTFNFVFLLHLMFSFCEIVVCYYFGECWLRLIIYINWRSAIFAYYLTLADIELNRVIDGPVLLFFMCICSFVLLQPLAGGLFSVIAVFLMRFLFSFFTFRANPISFMSN